MHAISPVRGMDRRLMDARVPDLLEGLKDMSGGVLVERTRLVTVGGWRTLEWFAFASATGFFRIPGGARIRNLYGTGFLSWSGSNQTLDGINVKRLVASKFSPYTRMQMSVQTDTQVTYLIYAGEVLTSPKIPF
jgi:hypothetical protein